MQLPSGTTVAAKLREAGVILLGESKLSQWANFRSCRPVLPFGGELMVGWGGGDAHSGDKVITFDLAGSFPSIICLEN
jgi:hypothetical protein